MVLARDGEVAADFSGVVEGSIAASGHGAAGFGYDPLFIPLGHDQTFAELGEAVKNTISHRSRALEKAIAWLAAQPKI
jgi:XTP/dITP diphosphohydrolase